MTAVELEGLWEAVGARCTPRQREVLHAYARLGSERLVAKALGISRATVRDHMDAAALRLGGSVSVCLDDD